MRLPETAIEAAQQAMQDTKGNGDTEGLREALTAFCESMGFEEEFDREGMDDLVIRNKPDRIRLVSEWRPVEGEDP